MKPIHIATSPLTNRIYAGNVLKCGTAWATNKQDVTGAACGAVCEHVMANGGAVEVTANGKPKFEITVRDVELSSAQPALSLPDALIKAAMESQREGCAEVVMQAAYKAADYNNLRDYELLRALALAVAKAPEAKP